MDMWASQTEPQTPRQSAGSLFHVTHRSCHAPAKQRHNRMKLTYTTHGTCSRLINLEIDDNGKVTNVEFVGGCDGNTKGIAQLVKGMDAQEAADRLAGIRCGYKPTSCPDQLAQALREALARS